MRRSVTAPTTAPTACGSIRDLVDLIGAPDCRVRHEGCGPDRIRIEWAIPGSGRGAGPQAERQRTTFGRRERSFSGRAAIEGRGCRFITACLDAGVPLRDVQIAARHADPRTTTRYDRARHNLNGHASYIVTAFIAGAS